MSAIEVSRISKTFGNNDALKNASFTVDRGEMVALIGASGSGKSTLLRHISGLVLSNRDDGAVTVFGETVQKNGRLGGKARKARSRIGIVFQQFNLVNRLPVLTNVLIGLLGQIPGWRGTIGWFLREERQRAMVALQRVGIDRLAAQRSSTLSGGQQQRAAIARALTQGADIILADEPIASLDPASSRKVMNTLEKINREDGVTVVVSLHQVGYAIKYCPRIIAMRQGEVVYDGPSGKLTQKFLHELYGDDSVGLFADADDAGSADPYEGVIAFASAS